MLEIERKFIVPLAFHSSFLDLEMSPEHTIMTQMYLGKGPGAVRIRLEQSQRHRSCYLTIKGEPNDGGLSRPELEVSYPIEFAIRILENLKPPLVDKIRYTVHNNKNKWVVDMITINSDGEIKHLLVAEFEHTDLDTVKNVLLPEWVGTEVTGDSRFSMFNLVTEGQLKAAWNAAYPSST